MQRNAKPSGLMLIHNFRPGPTGGAEIQAERLARGLVSLGHSMHILTNPVPEANRWPDARGKVPDAPEQEFFYGTRAETSALVDEDHHLIHQMGAGRVGMIHRPPFRLAYEIKKDVSPTFRYLIKHRKSYDVLHCHMAYGHAVVAVVAARRLRKPCIIKIACAGEFGELYAFSKFPGFSSALHVLHQTDAVIAISREVEEELLAYGFAPERILRIPNGVDTVFFQPAMQPEKPEKIRFLLVGRRQPQKGVDLLLKAVKMLKDAGLENEFEVQLCGSDSPEHDYPAMAVNLGVNQLVHFKPFQQDMRPVFQEAQCFVLPSRGEGLSNALLEAMAMGLPVIATRVSGTPDVVTDEQDGLLISPESVERLAEAMKRILLDADLRQKLGRKARQRVEAGFSLEHIAGEYSSLYSRLYAAMGRG